MSDHAAVATKHPFEADAGIAMLRAGGTAVDAAVAIGAVCWVIEPWMACAGGIGFLLHHEAGSGRTTSVEFAPRAPLSASPDMFRWQPEPPAYGLSPHNVLDEENSVGYLSVAAPGAVAGLFEAHRRWGRLPLQQVLEPAIHLAEVGYDADWQLGAVVASRMSGLARFPATAAQFLPGGMPIPFLAVSSRVTNRDLGSTLRLLVKHGADAFYRGELADAIDEDMRRNGGLLRKTDLENYGVVVGEPQRVTYRGYEILSPRGPGGHWTELQALKIIENFDLASTGHNSAPSVHILIEALRHAFADRFYHLADPEFESVPLDGLLNEGYARHVAGLIDPLGTAFEERDSPPVRYEDVALHDPWEFDPSGVQPPAISSGPRPTSDSHTTHFSVVDSERNVVSCTQTAGNLFGSMVTVPGTGILLNDGMVWFNPRPGTANSVAPGKRPLVNMGPMIVLKDGRPFLGLGAPGGQRIISCLTQVVSNVIDHGMSIRDAVEAPRVDCSTADTVYDDRLDGTVVAELGRLGHSMAPVREELNPIGWDFAHPACVMIDDDNKVRAAVDAFRIAEAQGL